MVTGEVLPTGRLVLVLGERNLGGWFLDSERPD